MIDQEKYSKIKKLIDKLEKEKQQAEGAKNQLLEELQKEFKCKDLASAKRKLKQYEKNVEELNTKFEKAFKVFARQNRKVLKKLAADDPELRSLVPRSFSTKIKREEGRKKTRKGT